ncbi:MAG: Calx-beta domain-containing protein [Pyrinomonadaceae bacterium]
MATIGGSGAVSFANVPAGTTVVAETNPLPAGWQFTSLSCSGDTDGGNVITGQSVSIDLDAAETQTCIFVNSVVPTPTPTPTPTPPVVWVNDVTIHEGDQGTKLFTFQVTVDHTPPANAPISIDYTTVNGTATVANNDYVPKSGTIVFTSNSPTIVYISVVVNGDITFEHNETFTIFYTNEVNAFLPDHDSLGTVYNDDIEPVFAVGDASGNEGNSGTTPLSFTVTRTGNPTAVASTVTFNTINGTATGPSDFVPVAGGTVVMAPNESTKTFPVLLNGDTTVEPNETFTLRIVQVTHGSIGDSDGSGTIVNDDSIVAGGIEGDIVDGSGSPVGDGTVFSNDVSVIRRMVLGLIPAPTTSPNQFQRADVAPRITSSGLIGDGLLTAADVTLIRQYNLGYLPQTPAGGPNGPAPTAPPTLAPIDNARAIRAVAPTVRGGESVTVSLQLESQGDESSAVYTMNFDPKVFTYVSSALGEGVPAGSYLGVNATEPGKLRLLIDSTNAYIRGSRQMATVTFAVSPDADAGEYPLTFNRTPADESVSDAKGGLVATDFEDGTINVTSKSQRAIVSGRVLDANGRGIRNATVSITDVKGGRRTTFTGSFGDYVFDEVETGKNYTIRVSNKRYRFAQRVINIADMLGNIDFVALE